MRKLPTTHYPLFTAVFFCIFLIGAGITYAATNINTRGTQNEKWGWNDVFGWIDMASTTAVYVASSTLQGYASSSIGDIMFDCATTRLGDTCATANFKTTNTDGLLSGWAWNDLIGWISMSGT